MLNTDSKGFTIENLSVLNAESSPNLPRDFPQDRIPKELCGHSLAQMLLCTMNTSTNLCAKQNKQYYMCRRERDAQLFSSIQDWESQKFTKLSKNDKEKYLQGLKDDQNKMETTLQSLPQSIANKHRRWRYQSDISQTEWRHKYLSAL